MVIRFLCKCGKKLKAPDEYIGKKVSCSKCGHISRVPDKEKVLAAKEKSKLSSASYVQLPPLSEVHKPEEHDSEETSPKKPEAPASSNIANQLLRHTDSSKADKTDSFDSGKPKPEESKQKKKTGIKKWLDENQYAKEVGKHYAKMILPGAAVVILVCYGLYSLMSSMVKTVDHPPLEIVSGIVTLDGQPLPRAEVTFVPQDTWKEDKKPAQSVGITDEQGKFSLNYLKDLKGAAVGNHIVRIVSYEKQVPAIYNVKSVLTYEVKDKNKDVEFKLISK
ncbi:transthyretin-like family protein [Gimesia aquarii]|uniref:Nickel uptake substrate-specific transmembrane region n=1 Tax=Gimesia aquarii TaxID=2527964 RepID=A0A517VW75_9PLAN|nr:hypothetical protein [Gimesia aquarii]QDT97256.1 Nickel uptake substrate-specific transmembrane region [Gimesia aquarii]